MEHPVANPRICQHAERVSAMPTELIEGFLKHLPLYRVLELSLAPTAGPNLRWAIEHSPTWAGVFQEHTDGEAATAPEGSTEEEPRSRLPQIQRLFTSVNDLAWNTYHARAMEAPPIRKRLSQFEIWGQSVPKEKGAKFFSDLEKAFLALFRDCFFNDHVHGHLNGLCMFLPRDVTAIWTSQDYRDSSEASDVKPWAGCLRQPSDSVITLAEMADSLRHHPWTVDEAIFAYPRLFSAIKELRQAKSAELLRLSDLYERYPTLLKEPFAPQSAPGNAEKFCEGMRRDAAKTVQGVMLPSFYSSKSSPQWLRDRWFRFRYPHPDLVPRDWCLRLLHHMINDHEIPEESGLDSSVYPDSMIVDFRRARDGLNIINTHEKAGTLRRVTEGPSLTLRHLDHRIRRREGKARRMDHRTMADRYGPLMVPHLHSELDWLESVCRCAEWLTANAESLNLDVEAFRVAPSEGDAPKPKAAPARPMPTVLSSAEDYGQYIGNEAPEVLAKQLRYDSACCDNSNANKMPSLLALYMPSAGSWQGREIGKALLPGFDTELQKLAYKDLIKKIQLYLENPPEADEYAPQPDGAQLAIDAIESQGKSNSAKVANGQEPSWQDTVNSYAASLADASKPRPRMCYICRSRISKPHAKFKAMCEPCGDFNMAGSKLSMPGKLWLGVKYALVTGARINLGFHVALRLLRCGANVIATTRYPRDAFSRYRAEPDSDHWIERLRIIGADFRSAKDAFALAEKVKDIVKLTRRRQLDILINNAAQTLTDSVGKEARAVKREQLLQFGNEAPKCLLEHSYTPRIRGVDADTRRLAGAESQTDPQGEVDEVIDRTDNTALTTPAAPSSWVQSLTEIPYEDVISAHSINTFVPLILIRELLPILANNRDDRRINLSGWAPRGRNKYVVNVSSREGIFESNERSRAKGGRHVHTNMSKAGLNMITETEAATMWEKYGIAMNTVDPGYMSAAPEFEDAFDGERPIGWEDGAGRVLWPVAVAETGQSGPVWGRFLKHYGANRVDVRYGRG